VDPLRIVMSELNEQDPTGHSFDLHLSRPITPIESEALRQLLATRFGKAELRGPALVTLRDMAVDSLERNKDKLQQIVAEAEMLASNQQSAKDTAAAQAQAKVENARRRAAAIDWTA
jgi:uncharacterized protein YfeS